MTRYVFCSRDKKQGKEIEVKLQRGVQKLPALSGTQIFLSNDPHERKRIENFRDTKSSLKQIGNEANAERKGQVFGESERILHDPRKKFS